MSVLSRFNYMMSVACVAVMCAVPLTFVISEANAKTYRIDPDHTRVVFFVDHLGFSKFPGQFNGVNGTIEFDFANNEASTADITIDATKIVVGHAVLEKKLQSADFFNTAKFPEIKFKSTTIKRKSISHGTITGDLTLLGVTKPVTLDVVFNGRKWNRFANAEFAGFSAKAKIRRSEFGFKTMLPEIGDEIELRIEVEAKEVRPAILAQ